jgi:hypothetical protein
MARPSVQAFTDAANQLALDEVQALVSLRHDQDVLILPAALFDGV